MILHSHLDSWLETRRRLTGQSIGFVPTMGALHAGHVSLIERARRENEIVVLSIFVNPTQFDDPGDLAQYPKTLESDLEMARKSGCDHVIFPNERQMYPDGYRYRVSENELSKILCGAHRLGHFDGVLTVVLKLLHIAQPTRAYFGEKDFQQLELVRGMVKSFFLPVEIVSCAIVREGDGLAMSSRNTRLSHVDRKHAPHFHQILTQAANADEARRALTEDGFDVDYVEDIAFGPSTRRFGAVRMGPVRLIDNCEVQR
ncbi:MAG: pantoate--beta-alanine ligase [Bdellovibrionaceae bacterium]|nr:pantoate--beta-alanine ligase [Pseudobdellovibrionaceae bacterium]